MSAESGGPVVVAGIDGSQESKNALRWAVRHTQQLGTLHAVAVWHLPVQFGYHLPVASESELEQPAREQLDAAVTELLPEFPDTRVDKHVVRGHPASVLIDYARAADLLVLGNKGRGAFVGMLVGSVALRCVQHAPCPVVVVR